MGPHAREGPSSQLGAQKRKSKLGRALQDLCLQRCRHRGRWERLWLHGGMRGRLQQSAAGAPPPPAAPNQDEQLAGQRPHVLAQNALGYESDTTLIQLLSHLPYIFC